MPQWFSSVNFHSAHQSLTSLVNVLSVSLNKTFPSFFGQPTPEVKLIGTLLLLQ